MADFDRFAKFRKTIPEEKAPVAQPVEDRMEAPAAVPPVEERVEAAPETDLGTAHAIAEVIEEAVPEADLGTAHVAAEVIEEAVPETEKLKPAGWSSPSYDRSRMIALEPERVTSNHCIAYTTEQNVVDAYKILRTQILQKMQALGGNSLMVTSALPGDGKTTTAINLAFTMAKEFQQTVLLVDCDLQQQDVHKQLGYQSACGLINYLLDECPVADLFFWPGIEKISVVSGGRLMRDSSELLGSPRMKELVSDMKQRYPDRFVIFDMQSVSAGDDALVFAPLVDHILMVVQEGKTPVNDIKRTAAMLPKEKLLGVMLNRHKAETRPVKNKKTYTYI